jgi:hypothetical protein
MTRLRSSIPFSIPLLLSACASARGTLVPLGPDHPASARAAELPVPDPSAFLREGTAFLLPAEDGHSHGAAPAGMGAFVCPMHPAVSADEPGRCAECGMKLVPRERAEPQHEEHPHER